ncbi:hypothetical protein ABG067_007876, partial [Albugo candida]
MESNNNNNKSYLDQLQEDADFANLSDAELAIRLSARINQHFHELPSSSSSSHQQNFIYTQQNYRELSPTLSVETLNTQTTTSSLVHKFKGKATINDLEKEVQNHNMRNTETIKAIKKNENIRTIDDPEDVVIEIDIPWSGNELNLNLMKSAPSWSINYGYGLRIGEVIYCTVNRREKFGCHKQFISKGKSSSTFTRHLEGQHKLTEKIIINILKEQESLCFTTDVWSSEN